VNEIWVINTVEWRGGESTKSDMLVAFVRDSSTRGQSLFVKKRCDREREAGYNGLGSIVQVTLTKKLDRSARTQFERR